MVLSVTLNPCVDVTLFVDGLKPHDTNRVQSTELDAGGKGVNLSRVAVELGGESVATGFLGGATGAKVRYVLDAQGVVSEFVCTAADTRVNYSVESGDGPPTTFNAKGGAVSPEEWTSLVETVRKLSGQAKWICFGGSSPPGVPEDATIQLATIARDHGAKVLIDADGQAMLQAMKFAPDFIKPNAKEAERLVGQPVETQEQAVAAAKQLVARLAGAGRPDAIVVVSRGGDGAVMAFQDKVWSSSGVKVHVKSTIGSGDSMLGGFLTGICLGRNLMDSFRLGLAAGAATAMTDSTEIARRGTVEQLLPQVPVNEVG